MGYYPRKAKIKTLATSVMRLLKRWASRVGCGEDVDRACQDISLCINVKAEEDRHMKPKKRVGVGEEASSIDPPARGGRLGRTERLVLAVLLANPLTPMTPAMIRAAIKERFGDELSIDAVYSALRRLMRRGWVERIEWGKYVLSSRFKSSDLYVENLRVGGRIVWSKRERGQPIPLSKALSLVESMGLAGEVINQAELISYPNLTSAIWSDFAELKREGVVRVTTYFNREEGPKVEVEVSHPPYTASPENYLEFVEQYVKALMVATEVNVETIMERIEWVEAVGLKRNATAWACRMRARFGSLIDWLGVRCGSKV